MTSFKQIRTLISNLLFENAAVDQILDKVSKKGMSALSIDEKRYLKQHSTGKVDYGLQSWLMSDDWQTFDDNTGEKLLYDEFGWDEDIFYNPEKTIRVISKILGKEPFSNSADWADANVWQVGSKGDAGVFLYFNDDENDCVLLARKEVDGAYEDQELKKIDTVQDLYVALGKITS